MAATIQAIMSQARGKKIINRVRFWMNVAPMPSGCWEWIGTIGRTGYGQFTINGRRHNASRARWIMKHGPMPPHLFVCHKCDNPRCVRLSHLFVGSAADNAADMAAKGRSRKGKTSPCAGEAHFHAKLDSEQIIAMRQLHRDGVTYKMLAKIFGVSRSNVCVIITGKGWKHVAPRGVPQ